MFLIIVPGWALVAPTHLGQRPVARRGRWPAGREVNALAIRGITSDGRERGKARVLLGYGQCRSYRVR